MIAVDTNIIVRFFTADDPEQFQRSVQIFKNEQIFIPTTVVLETEWVLRHAYHFSPEQIMAAFKKLLGLPNSYLENESVVSLAIEWHGNGLDFADAVHLAQSQHCSHMVTFDQRFIKSAQKITSCPVQTP